MIGQLGFPAHLYQNGRSHGVPRTPLMVNHHLLPAFARLLLYLYSLHLPPSCSSLPVLRGSCSTCTCIFLHIPLSHTYTTLPLHCFSHLHCCTPHLHCYAYCTHSTILPAFLSAPGPSLCTRALFTAFHACLHTHAFSLHPSTLFYTCTYFLSCISLPLHHTTARTFYTHSQFWFLHGLLHSVFIILCLAFTFSFYVLDHLPLPSFHYFLHMYGWMGPHTRYHHTALTRQLFTPSFIIFNNSCSRTDSARSTPVLGSPYHHTAPSHLPPAHASCYSHTLPAPQRSCHAHHTPGTHLPPTCLFWITGRFYAHLLFHTCLGRFLLPASLLPTYHHHHVTVLCITLPATLPRAYYTPFTPACTAFSYLFSKLLLLFPHYCLHTPHCCHCSSSHTHCRTRSSLHWFCLRA